jgi:5-methylcytosine-specific restriction endonuclease McrA
MKRFNDVPYRQVFQVYRGRARDQKREFTFDFPLFKELITCNCHYCDAPPSNKSVYKFTKEYQLYNGVDRKNNALGYTPDNCVPCCDICNKAKRAMSYKAFMAWIKRLVAFHGD